MIRGVRTIAVLGSTGSVGTQTLEVARHLGLQVQGLAAGTNADLLVAQAAEFRPRLVSCSQEVAASVRPHLPAGTRLVTGPEGAHEVAVLQVDTVVAAITGMAGPAATAAALTAGRHVPVPHNESRVGAAPLVPEPA